MYPLLTFCGSVPHDPAVAAWFDARPGELCAIARRWFAVMRSSGNDVRELVHDGCPVACVQGAPFGYVNVYRAHVGVGFFHGASLADPAGLLEGGGRYMRHVKLKPEQAPDDAALRALIAAAYADIRFRVAAAGRPA